MELKAWMWTKHCKLYHHKNVFWKRSVYIYKSQGQVTTYDVRAREVSHDQTRKKSKFNHVTFVHGIGGRLYFDHGGICWVSIYIQETFQMQLTSTTYYLSFVKTTVSILTVQDRISIRSFQCFIFSLRNFPHPSLLNNAMFFHGQRRKLQSRNSYRNKGKMSSFTFTVI